MAQISAIGELCLLSVIMLVVVYAADLLVIFGVVKITPKYEYAIAIAAGIILGTAVAVLDPLGSYYMDIFLSQGGVQGISFALSGFFTGAGIVSILILNRVTPEGKISPALYLHSVFDGFCLGFPAVAHDNRNTTIVMIILGIHRIIMTLALTHKLLEAKKNSRNTVLLGMFGFGVAAFVGSLIAFGICEGFNGKEHPLAAGFGCFLTAGSFIAAVFDDIFPDLKSGLYGLNHSQLALSCFFTLACSLLPLNYE